MNKQYNVRFLKAGLLTFEADSTSSIEELIKIAKQTLDNSSDQDLLMAMSDCAPSGKNPTRFDADSFQVEALEDPASDYEYIFYTPLWAEYAGLKE